MSAEEKKSYEMFYEWLLWITFVIQSVHSPEHFGCCDISETVLGVFDRNRTSDLFWKHPKLFCLYLSNEISLRGRFVFKTNGRTSSIISHKDHCCSFFMSWVIKATRMFSEKIWPLNFFENTQNCFTYISATKYRSDHCCSFYTSWDITVTRMLY